MIQSAIYMVWYLSWYSYLKNEFVVLVPYYKHMQVALVSLFFLLNIGCSIS